MKFSCLLPVHNEAKFLPYSLPSIFSVKPDETIIILDRCTDNSLDVAHCLVRKFEYDGAVRTVSVEKIDKGWNWQLSYLMYIGTKTAHNDIILTINADTQFGEIIREHLKHFQNKEVGWISFSYREYPFKYDSWLANKIQRIYTRRTPRGVNYAFRKSIIMDEIVKMKAVVKGIDGLLFNESLIKGYRNLFLRSDTIHLRPRGMKRDYTRGVAKHRVYKTSLMELLFNSFLYFRPLQIVGYLKARLNQNA